MKSGAEAQKRQSAQPDDPDGAERETTTITDSEGTAPLVQSCSEDVRIKISTHGVGGSMRGQKNHR
jgi:hypothetical protein